MVTDQTSGALDPSITVNRGAVVRERRTYGAGNLLASLADGKGHALSYIYDGFKRREAIFYPDHTSAAPDLDLHAYDANGNELVFQARSGAQIRFTYDALNRTLTKTPSGQAVISYGYDYTGRLIAAQSSSDSAAYQISYDTAGRKTGEFSPILGWTTATLDASGNLSSLNWPSSAAYMSSYAYDRLNRITNVYQGSVATGNEIASYTYNALSQRSVVNYGPAASPIATTWLTWTPANQVAYLAHVWNGGSVSFTYNYNQDHQRTGYAVSDGSFLPSGIAAQSTSYATNVLNQYTSVNSTTYNYDKRGNLISDGTWTYGYDTENRLVSAVGPSVNASYSYDPLGRRLFKNVNGTITLWASYGNREIAEYQGPGGGTVSLVRRFVYGPGLDEPVAAINAANVRTYHFQDALGSVIVAANAAGQLTEKYAYTAFGTTFSTGGNTAAFRYAGRRYDPETGLYFNRTRSYSPALGRFLQTDPIETDGGINLYAYVSNDPVNAIDPRGLAPQSPSEAASTQVASSEDTSGTGLAFVPPVAAAAEETATTAIAKQALPRVGLGPLAALTLPLALSGDTPVSSRTVQFVYLTYTRTNPDTNQVYSGRTSGWAGDVNGLNALAAERGAAADQQRLTDAGFGPPVVDRYSDSYSAIRGREQQLIDYYGGAQSVGGTSANRINGVSDWNPLRPLYMYDSTYRWGALPDNSPARSRLW